MSLEKTDLTIGYIPLADAAPLVWAKEKKLFEKYGLNVSLSREKSWARIRDKVSWGELDGAHMLAPMVIASVLGVERGVEPFSTALALNLNGNAITVSNQLYAEMCVAGPEEMQERPISAAALRKVIANRISADKPPLTFAMVFPFSSHNYQLRYWLAAGGIHPDRDVRLIVVPPPQVTEQLRTGAIDGYCVGEPWNAAAVEEGIGTVLLTSQELWGFGPEKVFGVNARWAKENQSTYFALLCALLEACKALNEQAAREEVSSLLAAKDYLDQPTNHILPALLGMRRRTAGNIFMNMPDFNIFHRYAANFPWRSHASWFISQMYRWGQLDKPVQINAVARQAYDVDLYRAVATKVGVAHPLEDMKVEGGRHHPYVLTNATKPIAFGANRFIDGRVFDPSDVVGYIESFERHRLKVPMRELRQMNELG